MNNGLRKEIILVILRALCVKEDLEDKVERGYSLEFRRFLYQFSPKVGIIIKVLKCHAHHEGGGKLL